MLAAGLDAGVDAVDLVLADQVLDGGRDHHHLVGGDQAFAASWAAAPATARRSGRSTAACGSGPAAPWGTRR